MRRVISLGAKAADLTSQIASRFFLFERHGERVFMSYDERGKPIAAFDFFIKERPGGSSLDWLKTVGGDLA